MEPVAVSFWFGANGGTQSALYEAVGWDRGVLVAGPLADQVSSSVHGRYTGARFCQ